MAVTGCEESNSAETGMAVAVGVVSGGALEYAMCMIGCIQCTAPIEYIADGLDVDCK
jgi:hypothetical protein